MAVTVVAVTGTVLTPTSATVTEGKILIRPSTAFAVDDSGTSQWVVGPSEVTIGSNGAVSFNIIPNDTGTPAGTFYKVTYYVTQPVRVIWGESWTVGSTPSSQDLGDIERTYGDGLAIGGVIPQVSALPAAGSDYRGRWRYIPGGAGVADKVYVCLKGDDDAYDWQIIASGELT